MKIKLLLIVLLSATLSFANDITKGSSDYGAGVTYSTYIINGKNEKCEVVYGENEWTDSTTCISLTNSKKVKVYCTKNKTMCKTEKEVNDFVTTSVNGDTEETKVLIILKEWSQANNDKNTANLSKLYAKEVTYYGKKLINKKCITDKKRAFKKFPDFYQRISSIDYLSVIPNIYKVAFDKSVMLKKSDKYKNYPSYLLVNIKTSKILAEGDDVTDGKSKAEKFDRIYTDSDGKEYLTTFNKHGASMKSKKHTLYLGKNCDASINGKKGEWEWANAGFEARFKDKTIVFRGELLIENNGKCGFSFYNKEESNNNPKPIKTSTPKEKCKREEDVFSKKYKVFTNAQLNPKETSNGIFRKQLKARDSALKFVESCDGVSRNILWNGGYDIDDIKDFIRKTNIQERLMNDLNNAFL